MTCLLMFNMEVCWKINDSLFNIYISHNFSHSFFFYFRLKKHLGREESMCFQAKTIKFYASFMHAVD